VVRAFVGFAFVEVGFDCRIYGMERGPIASVGLQAAILGHFSGRHGAPGSVRLYDEKTFSVCVTGCFTSCLKGGFFQGSRTPWCETFYYSGGNAVSWI
jgi:hypothetical protein